MCKFRIRSFFRNQGFQETYQDCFETGNVAFVIEDRELICCIKDSNGYKIQKRTPLASINGIVRTQDGTAIY